MAGDCCPRVQSASAIFWFESQTQTEEHSNGTRTTSPSYLVWVTKAHRKANCAVQATLGSIQQSGSGQIHQIQPINQPTNQPVSQSFRRRVQTQAAVLTANQHVRRPRILSTDRQLINNNVCCCLSWNRLRKEEQVRASEPRSQGTQPTSSLVGGQSEISRIVPAQANTLQAAISLSDGAFDLQLLVITAKPRTTVGLPHPLPCFVDCFELVNVTGPSSREPSQSVQQQQRQYLSFANPPLSQTTDCHCHCTVIKTRLAKRTPKVSKQPLVDAPCSSLANLL